MMSSGYLFKFMGRLNMKVIKEPGDLGVDEIGAQIRERDGPDTVVGAN